MGLVLLSPPSRAMEELPVNTQGVLTLPSAMRALLENNFSLRAQRLEVGISQDGLDQAWAEFDPQLFMSGTYEDSARQLNAVDYSGIGLPVVGPQDTLYVEENLRTAIGIAGRLPGLGTDIELSGNLNQLENDVNRSGRFYFPELESGVSLTVSQPLLKDFLFGASMSEVKQAKYGIRIAERSHEVEVVNKLIEMVNAYYDLSFALENIAVKRQAVEVAERLLIENREREEVGRMTILDVTQAEVQVSEAKEDLVLARNFESDRRVRLLKLIVGNFQPGALPEFTVDVDLGVPASSQDARALTAIALAERPDLMVAENRLGQNQVGYDRARSDRLPELRMRFTYGVGGLDDNIDDSVDELFGDGADFWSAGLVFSVPLTNRHARAGVRIMERRMDQDRLALQEMKTGIALDVSRSLDRIVSLRERLLNAEKSSELASAGMMVESVRLEAGQSTSYAVVDLQQKSTEARTRVLAAQVELKKAQAELWATTGQLPERLGLVINPPEESKKEPFFRLTTGLGEID